MMRRGPCGRARGDDALSDDILLERRGSAGLVTLNRPEALNAINHPMVLALRAALTDWARDPAITRIVVEGAGGRAFSAGGDIRELTDLGRAGRHEAALAFWRDEYVLNTLIKRYPKPYVSLIDGIVMGGGVGISLHGGYRVAGGRYRFAMPEVSIGFFPDVGATHALPRLPGRTGFYIALTGERVGPADAIGLGLATHHVASADLEAVRGRLIAGEPVEAVLDAARVAAGEGALMAERALIDRCFSAPGVVDILGRLDEEAFEGSAFAAATAATMRTKSPTSLCLAFEQLTRGGSLDFEDCMRTEFRIVSRIVHGRDFYEGVRITLVERGQTPRWDPATLALVDPAAIAGHFAPLGASELELP